MLRPLSKRAAVGLLADKRNDARLELPRDRLQPRGAARKVRRAKVAGTGRRPWRCVRDADSEREELELLRRVVEPWGEARCMEQAPEVVAWIREVSGGGIREPARVDPAEDNIKTRLENVGNR